MASTTGGKSKLHTSIVGLLFEGILENVEREGCKKRKKIKELQTRRQVKNKGIL